VQACRHFIWLDLFPWAVQCRLFWELCRRLTFPLSLHLQLIGRTFVWWQTIIRLECVGGPDDWEQLPEKLVSLLRDNQIVDACSGLSSSRLSGIGCISLCWWKFQHCMSSELDPVDGYVLAILMIFSGTMTMVKGPWRFVPPTWERAR
jgi:hypothetical protein